jgi:CO/xanthine dehydrogenase Mo-binding subunit
VDLGPVGSLHDRRPWPRPHHHREDGLRRERQDSGFKVDTIANFGAYMSLFSSAVPTYLYATLLSGQYDIANIYANVRAVYTNTVPVDAYRGAGGPRRAISSSG